MLDSKSTDIVRRASIEELARHRARALELFAQAYDLIMAANAAWGRAAPTSAGLASLPGRTAEYLRYATDDRRAGWVEEVRRHVDRDIWRHLINATDLRSLMDRKAREEFEQGLEKDVPPATPDNAAATMFDLLGKSDMIFRRGLIEAFRRLDHAYASNDAFKIGRRAVMTFAIGVGGYFNSRAADELADVERVFCVLDGKPEGRGAARAAIDTARHAGAREARTPYFFVKWFKNGNMHVYFERADLVEKANKIIAEYYGATLADGARA